MLAIHTPRTVILYGFTDDHHILKTRAQQFQLFSNAAADMATMEITTYEPRAAAAAAAAQYGRR